MTGSNLANKTKSFKVKVITLHIPTVQYCTYKSFYSYRTISCTRTLYCTVRYIVLYLNRKSCKWCRFHRCLSEAGLQVELVLSAQERRQLELKKTQNRLARRRKRAKGSRAMTTTFASSISSPRWSGQDDGNDDNGNGDNGNDNSDNPSSALVSLSGGDRRLLFPDFGEEERARFMLLYHRLHASNHVKRFQFLACDLGR